MSTTLREVNGVRVLECAELGDKLGSDRDASDLLSESFTQRAQWIEIPVARLNVDFFRLRTGMAGAFVQKIVNYQRRLAIVGDVSRWIGESNAFRDFVVEANRGQQLWFVADRDTLHARLSENGPG